MTAATAQVAVVGSDGPAVGERVLTMALEVGRALARRGALVVCGGLGGVMEAACRGAREEGGLTVGLLPGLDRGEANAHVQIALPTGLGEARNALVVRAADAVIAVGGEFGTLSEIALALKAGTPVVGVGTWELSKGGRAVDAIDRADGAEDAVERALALVRRQTGDPTTPPRPTRPWNQPSSVSAMAEAERRRVVVHGRVQGVFFRDSTQEEAERRGVAGWITNRSDGAVEAVFEGDAEVVRAMVAFCREGPQRADVDQVDESVEDPEGLSGFDVR